VNRSIPFAWNFLYFAGSASISPFIVLYYQEHGFGAAQISLLAGLPPLVTLLFAPLWTNLADATGRHRLVMSVTMAMTVATVILFPFLASFVLVMVFVLLLYFFLSPLIPLADSAALSMLADRKDMYGRVRLGGTIGWGLAAPLAGALIKVYSLDLGFWLGAFFLLLGLFVSQRLSFGLRAAAGSQGRVRDLLADPHWINFLVLAFFGGLAVSAATTFYAPYMNEIGGNEFYVGIALLVATLTEVPVFFFGDRLLRRFRAFGLLILALVITGVRSLLFALSAAPVYAILAQLLNGLTFPAMWMAGVSYADQHAPDGLKSTAQGLFAAMSFGFGAAVGGFAGGFLLAAVGGRGLFLVYGLLVLAGAAIATAVENRLTLQHAEI
jgi:PPP family 3-phenylpropionic acid transporter